MLRRELVFIILALTAARSLHSEEVRNFWFAGAEINRYELSQIRYGQAHPGHAEFIFVTEPFLTDRQVKNETATSPSTDILKLNALRTFNTGIYSYRTMTSIFQALDLKNYPHALKTNTSIQDWCGQVFQQLNKTDTGWRGELRSYFQKDGDHSFELKDVWLEDELWTRLRLAPDSLPTGKFQLVPGALISRFNQLPITAFDALATLENNGKETNYTVHYSEINRRLIIRFDTKFPHIIRAWEEHQPTGATKATLTHRVMNSQYWLDNQSEDATKRRLLGLNPIAN